MIWQDQAELVKVAAGRKKCDLIVRGATLVNVYTKELLPNFSVGIYKDRIAFVVEEDVEAAAGVDVIAADGRFIIPGFIDSHTHLDVFCSIPEYLRYIMLDGTTTVISESSAIANAMGMDGVLWFLESLKDQPVKVFTTAPPTVPGNPGLQEGHHVGVEDVEKLLDLPQVLGIGESYWSRVVAADPELMQFFAAALARRKVAEGHGAGARKFNLNAFAASGISSCHEAISAQDAKDRLRLGLKTIIREGSIRKDLEAVATLANEPLDFRNLSLCTDGIDPRDLVRTGTMLPVVQKAIDLGFDPLTAIQMATLNNAQRFGLEQHLGAIAPGRFADMIITPSLTKIEPETVISNGKVVAAKRRAQVTPKSYRFPDQARQILKFTRINPEDLQLKVSPSLNNISATIIHQETEMLTRESRRELEVKDGEVQLPPEGDVLKLVAISTLHPERKAIGFLSGFGLQNGACASTYTWDTANLIVVGDNDEDLALAINRLGELGGGFILCSRGKILCEVALPIGGLISQDPLEKFAANFERLTDLSHKFGCRHHDPFLSLQVLSFVGVPHLRISDRGMISIRNNQLIPILHHVDNSFKEVD